MEPLLSAISLSDQRFLQGCISQLSHMCYANAPLKKHSPESESSTCLWLLTVTSHFGFPSQLEEAHQSVSLSKWREILWNYSVRAMSVIIDIWSVFCELPSIHLFNSVWRAISCLDGIISHIRCRILILVLVLTCGFITHWHPYLQ